MNLALLATKIAPLLILAGIVYFFYRANPAQRKAVAWTWVLPGLGHFQSGFRKRGYYLGGLVIGLFLFGLVLSGFLCVSPLDRHPIWAIAQAPGGFLTILTWLATRSLHLASDNPTYGIGCLYVGVACLLNLVLMCDLWDLLEDPKAESEAA
jgi:hypothetical protein